MFKVRKKYCADLWELRWKFFYDRFKIPKAGMWNMHLENDTSTRASFNKQGIVMAAVEGKNKITKEIKEMVVCSGVDYLEHRWIAAAPIPSVMGLKGSLSIEGSIQGMTLVTRDYKYHVYCDGNVYKEPMREARITRYDD